MKKIVSFSLFFSCLFVLSIPAFAADGGNWWDVFGWFGDITNFVMHLIVPEPNYFNDRLYHLNEMVNAKFAGLGQLYQTLDSFFNIIENPPSAGITFKLPSNFLYRGYRGVTFDALASAKPYMNFIRTVFTSGFCLLTVIACYHKIRTFFTEEE